MSTLILNAQIFLISMQLALSLDTSNTDNVLIFVHESPNSVRSIINQFGSSMIVIPKPDPDAPDMIDLRMVQIKTTHRVDLPRPGKSKLSIFPLCSEPPFFLSCSCFLQQIMELSFFFRPALQLQPPLEGNRIRLHREIHIRADQLHLPLAK